MSHPTIARRATRLVIALVTAAAVLLGATSVAQAAAKPTVVLVHGAWADSGSWNGVALRLQKAGYTVDAPPNPLRGLANDSATISDFIKTISGPIVLVGHSYGGAVITDAATGNANVKALVYVDAYAPDEGESISMLTGAGSCLAVKDPTTVFNFAPFPGAPEGVVDAYVKQSLFARCFANTLPAATGNMLGATQRPLALNALTDASTAPAWKTIPSWAVVGTVDNIIPMASQLTMAKRAGAHITQIKAPHLSMVAQPAAVTAVITKAATATG
jgi:pimeloyl-ACP methyl ester carboxylesterase